MKTVLLLVCMGLLAGCAHQPAAVQSLQPSGDSFISKERAVEIAKGVNRMDYDRDGTIEVELLDNQYIVTFPVDKSTEPGTRYRGPDYAARYWIDAKTGEVLRRLRGS